MEIKFKLDTKKATHAAVAIAATYTLCRVSKHSNSPQLAAANAIALIVIIAILYGPCSALTKTSMHNYYTQADGIPQYINMLEDAQKKGTRAGMPIANVELVMMASAAVLAAQHFPCEVDNWEGLPSASCTWTAWKTAFCLAHVKRQQQILALGGGEPLGGAHGVIPAVAPAIGHLETALNNPAVAATNDTAVLQQLIAANLALTATITSLTATNKKLVDVATRQGGTPAATPGWGWTQAATQTATPVATPTGIRVTKKPCPRNYCSTHDHCVSKHHLSATYANKAPGHHNNATGMANIVYCNTNDLCQNNYYFALSTPSSCNPTNLPTSHTGIADSGASGIYFASYAPVANLNPTAPSVGVRVANGLPVRSVASATLASAPSLPTVDMQGHVMPSFPHTLIGLGPLPILATRLFSPSMLSWSSIWMATASLTNGANKMAPASGTSLSRPPCQSCRNLTKSVLVQLLQFPKKAPQ
jgi:hypothetical protein